MGDTSKVKYKIVGGVKVLKAPSSRSIPSDHVPPSINPRGMEPARIVCDLVGPSHLSINVAARLLAQGLWQLGYDAHALPETCTDKDLMLKENEIAVTWSLDRVRRLPCTYRICFDPADGWCLNEGAVAERNRVALLTLGLSRHSCQLLHGCGCERVVVLPLSADQEVYRPGERVWPVFPPKTTTWFGEPVDLADRFVFLTQASIQPRKGVYDVIGALAEEFGAQEPVVLVVKAQHQSWGEDGRERIRKMLPEQHAPILYTSGILQPDEQAACYRAADCYVTCSRMEGWGLPPHEAMACGTMVVATDASGHRDFLTQDNAILIPTTEQCLEDVHEEASYGPLSRDIMQKLTWHRPKIADIRTAMRKAYVLGKPTAEMRTAMERTIRWFSPAFTGSVFARAADRVGLKIAQRIPELRADTPTVALAIPVLNYRDLLRRTLESLGTTCGVDFTVLVRDDGSDDGTQEMVEQGDWGFPVLVTRADAREGLPKAREALKQMAAGLDPEPEFFCFLDGDLTFPDPDWLLKLCSLHIDGISGPKMVLPNGNIWSAGGTELVGDAPVPSLRGFNEPDRGQWDVPMHVDHVPGACMLMRMELARQLKADLRYPPRYCDDTELCMQTTHLVGEHCWYWPQVVVTHHAEMTRKRTVKQEKDHADMSAAARQLFVEKWFCGNGKASPTEDFPRDPLVSVVMPLYQYGDLVWRAIKSVQAQTFRDWELIIVDDGSTDGGADVVKRAAQRDKRIRVIQHEVNRGLAEARNTGYAVARGRYICLLDSDDEYLPHALRRLVIWMQDHPDTGLAYGNFQFEDGKRGTAEPYNWTRLTDHDHIPCQATIMDRYLVQAIAGNDPRLLHAEDWDYWLRAAYACNDAVDFIGPEPLYILHQHPRQRTRDEVGIRAHDHILRARAKQYGQERRRLSVGHTSLPLVAGGQQEVMRQIIMGAPSLAHGVYVEDPIAPRHVALPENIPVMGYNQLLDFGDDVLHVHHFYEPEIHDWLTAHGNGSALLSRHGLQEYPNFINEYTRQISVWPEEAVAYVPNGIDFDAVRDAPIQLHPIRPTIMTCLRFAHQKRPALWVDVCEELARRRPKQLDYIMVGGNEQEPMADAILERWTLFHEDENSAWLGVQSHSAVLSMMKSASAFVLCSDSETRPLVLMEAVACGAPAIAADVAGTKSIQGLAEVLPLDAGPSAWADAILEHLGRREPLMPAEHDGRLMARRYEWLYRGTVIDRVMRGFGEGE